ncbi:alpha/beta hydrolase family protein [Maledivibacter halophilus]|uniref:Alpha/beta hydrolase family protein n=1 Tax=Maledivibacter halophilus TaxID=36842 RepID=A0A1T5MX49_9FIRM|nr:alpha/beta fold hydrolase [Maledivibacter halophilus]SKC92811.1 Alpha/beta hydrolase family protein [Maledivibacter halophilus]
MKRKILFTIMIAMLILILISCTAKDNETKETVNVKNEFMSLRESYKSQLTKKTSAPQKYKELPVLDNASLITYESGDLSLKALISNNVDENKKHPAIVFVHGGFAFDIGYWEIAKPYIDSGFIVMTPMLRGENGNQGNYELIYGEVDDVIAAGKYLKELSYVDPDNIFLVGHSSGGAISMLASMMPSDYKAISSFGGAPLDLQAELNANKQLEQIIPFDTSISTEFDLRTPIKYPHCVSKPLYMFVESESHIPGIQDLTKSFSEKIKENGMESEYYVIQGNHVSALDESVKKSIEIFKNKIEK